MQDRPLFLHVPQTEQEVVCLFALLLSDLEEFPKPAVIERVQTAFPDCIVQAQGKRFRIELRSGSEMECGRATAVETTLASVWCRHRSRRRMRTRTRNDSSDQSKRNVSIG
jgi:hypothetical protein